MDSSEGELFIKEQKVESVQLAGRDYWLLAIVKTTTGGGIISRTVKKKKGPKIGSQTLFIDDDGRVTFMSKNKGKGTVYLKTLTEINDGEWHEVVVGYEEKLKRYELILVKLCTAIHGKISTQRVIFAYYQAGNMQSRNNRTVNMST